MKFIRKSKAKYLPALMLLSIFTATHALAAQVSIDSRDFMPYEGDHNYGESTAGNLTCANGNSSNLFIAQVPLPPAPAELDIKQLAVWGGDISSSDAEVFLERFCQNEFSASTPVRTSLSNVFSSGSAGNYFNAAALNFRVSDQRTCIYMVSLQFGVNNCPGPNLSVARVRVRYDLVQQPVAEQIFKNGFEN